MKRTLILPILLCIQFALVGQVGSLPDRFFLRGKSDIWPVANSYLRSFKEYPTPALEMEVGLSCPANLTTYSNLQLMPKGTSELFLGAGVLKYFPLRLKQQKRSFTGLCVGFGPTFYSIRQEHAPGAPLGILSRERAFGGAIRLGYQQQLCERLSVGMMLEAKRQYRRSYYPLHPLGSDRTWDSMLYPRVFIGYVISK